MTTDPAPPGRAPHRFTLGWPSGDPRWLVVKRALRSAAVAAVTLAVARAITSDNQVAIFASFGAIAYVLFLDLGGPLLSRGQSLITIAAVGAVLVALGTLCSQNVAAAVVSTAVVALAVLFSGVLSPRAAQATMLLILSYSLAVMIPGPPDEIPARLAGWALGAGISIAATLLVWPRPVLSELNKAIADAATSLSKVAQSHGEGRIDGPAADRARTDLGKLRQTFEATPYRPTGLGPDEMATSRMVGRMEWVGRLALAPSDSAPGSLELEDVRSVHGDVATVLRSTATMIGRPSGSAGFAESISALEQALASLHDTRQSAIGQAVDRLIGQSADPGSGPGARLGRDHLPADPLPSLVDPSFQSRALGLAAEVLGAGALESAGREVPEWMSSDMRSNLVGSSQRWLKQASAYISLKSVWFRNSLRGALGLALAVGIASTLGVSHGFWVVLGTVSVLRSNATSTGSTVLQAIGGTTIGVAIGAGVLTVLGTTPAVLWTVLVVFTFVAALAPTMLPFAAAQAAFTILVIALFNILIPTGWQVGLVRIEDVGLGCAISLAVGLAMWPRGAGGPFTSSLCDAYQASGRYLLAAIHRICGIDDPLDDLSHKSSDVASARLDDAYRQYITERGAKSVRLDTATDLLTGCVRLRLAAYSLATMPLHRLPADRPILTSVAEATLSVTEAAQRASEWYPDLCGALANPGRAASGPPEIDGMRPDLLEAFQAAAGSGDPARVLVMLRLLWADDVLEDQHALQCELERVAAPLMAVHRPEDRRSADRRGSISGPAI